MKFLITLTCIIVASFHLYAQPTFTVNGQQAMYSLHDYLEVLEDTTNQLAYPAVKNKNFISLKKFGQTTQASNTYWGRITVKSKLAQDQKFVLYLGSANICDVYIQAGQQLIKEKTGRLVPLSQKKIKQGRNAPVPLLIHEKSDQQIIYIYFRFKNLDGRPPLIDPKLYTNAAWYQRFKMRNLGIGGLNALLWTLVLYQFSLFLLTKYKVYLYSSLYLFFNSINSLSISGILPEYLLGEYPKANEITWLITWISIGIFYMIFCRAFAQTHRHLKTWDKILKGFSTVLMCSLVIVSISLFFTFRLDVFLQLNFIIGIGLITFMPFFALAVLRKKIKGTFLFAIGVIQISVFIFISYFYTLQNPTSVVSNILDRITVAIEGILFTIALALRLKVLEAEKNEAQQNQIKIIAHQKETLEKKVKERTQELEEKNEEIQIYHKEMLVQNEWLENQQEEIKNQQEALNQKNKTLLQQNTLISQSIQAAQTIQSAILPNKQLLHQLLGEYFMIYRPKDVVSGDFYWLQQVDEQIFLAIVDCTGHGVPGAFMSMIGNTLLNKIILVQEVHSPAEIFNRLHKEIALQLQQEEVHHIYGMEMTLLSWQPSHSDTQEFVFCGAKTPLMYVLPNSQELQILSGDRRSIGGYQPENVFFSDQVLNLPKGSMIYLGSDGFQDQHNPDRKKIGKRNLQSFIQQQAQLPIDVQKQHLENFLANHQQETSQRDDIMLLGFRV